MRILKHGVAVTEMAAKELPKKPNAVLNHHHDYGILVNLLNFNYININIEINIKIIINVNIISI